MNGSGPTPEQPIRALRDQEIDTSPDFLLRVRRKIQRRATVSHFASFSWHLPRLILTEMAGVLNHLLNALGGRKES